MGQDVRRYAFEDGQTLNGGDAMQRFSVGDLVSSRATARTCRSVLWLDIKATGLLTPPVCSNYRACRTKPQRGEAEAQQRAHERTWHEVPRAGLSSAPSTAPGCEGDCQLFVTRQSWPQPTSLTGGNWELAGMRGLPEGPEARTALRKRVAY